MKLQKYEKIDMAKQMLETALRLFKEGNDYFSVLQITSASEEILGKYLKSKRIKNSLDLNAEAFVLLRKKLSGKKDKIGEAKYILNKPRNSGKHMNEKDSQDFFVFTDPRYDAEEMLERAIENWRKLNGVVSSSMEEFLISVEKNLGTEFKQI